MVDLKRLGHLVALADECHFARAAERVHLSQPAFSRSIQLLESQVGMKLFDRETGEVKPTPAGLFLIDRARRLLFDARNLHRDVQLFRGTQLGDTAFGAGPLPAASIMTRVVTELRREYPAVALRLETGNWLQLLDRLLAEETEFFVANVTDLPPEPRITVTSVGRQRGYLYTRADHPLAGRSCTVAQAWEYGIASSALPSAIKPVIARRLGLPDGETPAVAVECHDMALLRTLVAQTDTVMVGSDASLQAELDAGVLVRLDVTDLPEAYAEIGIVALANRTPSPMASRAIGCVQSVAAQVNVPSP